MTTKQINKALKGIPPEALLRKANEVRKKQREEGGPYATLKSIQPCPGGCGANLSAREQRVHVCPSGRSKHSLYKLRKKVK